MFEYKYICLAEYICSWWQWFPTGFVTICLEEHLKDLWLINDPQILVTKMQTKN